MDPAVSLCGHLGSLAAGGSALTLAPGEIIEWHDGPVAAIARCAACGAAGWVELVDCSGDGVVRVFALAGLRERDAALYLRNAQKGSCDPRRGRAELEALAAAAGPFERLVAFDVRAGRVLAAGPPCGPVPPGAWPARMPAREDAAWFECLGLDKAARGAGRQPD